MFIIIQTFLIKYNERRLSNSQKETYIAISNNKSPQNRRSKNMIINTK